MLMPFANGLGFYYLFNKSSHHRCCLGILPWNDVGVYLTDKQENYVFFCDRFVLIECSFWWFKINKTFLVQLSSK